MDVRSAYNLWAEQYDSNDNKTRDLEAAAIREMLANVSFHSCLEIGCGTGKNTGWLAGRAEELLAVDFSEEMLQQARQKTRSKNVVFVSGDINSPWSLFAQKQYDLVTFSLVLEHIETLDHVFREASRFTRAGGMVYLGELHPVKQYSGSKARFDTPEGPHVLACYNHHVSDFMQAAGRNGFAIRDLREYFDGDDRSGLPRILSILFTKTGNGNL